MVQTHVDPVLAALVSGGLYELCSVGLEGLVFLLSPTPALTLFPPFLHMRFPEGRDMMEMSYL